MHDEYELAAHDRSLRQNWSTLWCAASLARRAETRVTVVLPRAPGVVAEARRAAVDMGVDITVAINAASTSVRLESPLPRRARD
jgi:hypothetical protein